MYPEAVLFPSIHWKIAPDNCAVVGAIPAPLLTEASSGSRFCSIQEHVRSRVTNLSSCTSTLVGFIAFCYDMLSNLAANKEDVR